jgi:Tfp pilus assembly protein FimT
MIEIMTTVVIVGIVAAMASPHFQKGIERIKFRSQSKDVVSMLRTARSNAISEKALYGVNFDFESGAITMFRDDTNLGSNQYDAGGDSIISVDSLNPQEYGWSYSTFTNSAVVFRPNGSASSTGDISLWYSGPSERSESFINVLASTGRAKIVSMYHFENYEQDVY